MSVIVWTELVVGTLALSALYALFESAHLTLRSPDQASTQWGDRPVLFRVLTRSLLLISGAGLVLASLLVAWGVFSDYVTEVASSAERDALHGFVENAYGLSMIVLMLASLGYVAAVQGISRTALVASAADRAVAALLRLIRRHTSSDSSPRPPVAGTLGR